MTQEELNWTSTPLPEDERKALEEKYAKIFDDIVKKYPGSEPDPELEQLKKTHKFHQGDIYKLKDGAQIWLIDMQYTLKYEQTDNEFHDFYIHVNQWAWDNSSVFGWRVEKNLYGMLSWDKCEIEVAFSDIDLSKCYKKEEMVNPVPWMDFMYFNS